MVKQKRESELFNPFDFNHPGGQISSPEDMNRMIDEIHEQRYERLQSFYNAFLSETGLRPSEVELVESRERDGQITYRFQQIDRSSSIFNNSRTLLYMRERIEFEKVLETPVVISELDKIKHNE